MSSDRHARVKAIFHEAVELTPDARESFLADACDGDDALRREVDSLLAHHSPRSLIRPKSGASSSDEGQLNPVSARGTSKFFAKQLFATTTRRRTAVVSGAALLLLLGLWTEGRVSDALEQIRGEELHTILSTDVVALDIWIEQQKILVRQWAQDPRLLRFTRDLTQLSDDGASVDTIRNASTQKPLDALVRQWMRDSPGHIAVALYDRNGNILYNDNPNHIGLELDKGLLLTALAPAMAGQTVFGLPARNADFIDDWETREDRTAFRIFNYFRTPVRGEQGAITGLLTTAQEADGEFSRILRAAQLGETGETYAFDADGWMLSESRATAELREVGMLPELAGELDWNKNAVLNIQVRDPGGNLTEGFEPETKLSARPLTRLAALAIGARDEEESELLTGVVTAPYRNYRGVEVIGAWRWLPDHGFGVATEIEATEAFAPLRYLNITFGVLLAFLTIAVGTTVASSFSLARLRGKVGELRQFGPYALREKIGEGGMGKVYLADHALLKRPTAVKVLSGAELTEASIARFEREVQQASRLSHPNTISIFDFGRTDDGVFYYAMEYLDGMTLAELVSRFGPLPPARAIYLLEQVCASLGEAHGRGLIHRDIKPLNIMICHLGGEYDIAKVLDFGLVKSLDDPGTKELTGRFEVGGTPVYMAPERLTSPETVDARADIYAVGAVAYYLLSGRSIFQSIDEVSLLSSIPSTEPVPIADVATNDLPPALASIVMACLSKKPEDRPASVDTLAAALGGVPLPAVWTKKDAHSWWAENALP